MAKIKYDRDKLEAIADDVLASYDFGDDLQDMEHGNWNAEEDDGEIDFTKVLYATWKDDPDADSTKVSFHVRFSGEGKVVDAYAYDMDSGNEFGKRGDKMESKKTLAKKIIEDLKFMDGPKQPEGSSDIIDDKLNKEVTILQGILMNKKLGTNASLQTGNGAMINILALGAKNDEVGATPPEKKEPEEKKPEDDKDKCTAAAKVIGAASSIGATESYKVSKNEYAIAQKMKAKGYKYAMKVPGDERLLFFKSSMDVGPHLRSEKDLKPEWNGSIEDLVIED